MAIGYKQDATWWKMRYDIEAKEKEGMRLVSKIDSAYIWCGKMSDHIPSEDKHRWDSLSRASVHVILPRPHFEDSERIPLGSGMEVDPIIFKKPSIRYSKHRGQSTKFNVLEYGNAEDGVLVSSTLDTSDADRRFYKYMDSLGAIRKEFYASPVPRKEYKLSELGVVPSVCGKRVQAIVDSVKMLHQRTIFYFDQDGKYDFSDVIPNHKDNVIGTWYDNLYLGFLDNVYFVFGSIGYNEKSSRQ